MFENHLVGFGQLRKEPSSILPPEKYDAQHDQAKGSTARIEGDASAIALPGSLQPFDRGMSEGSSDWQGGFIGTHLIEA